MKYCIRRTDTVPELKADWNDQVWAKAETGALTYVRPETGEHIPDTRFRLLHDNSNIYGIFQVRDRYVRVLETEFQAGVCKDSCVEFFFQPHAGKGYFNLEMNAGGAFLIYYVRDHSRRENGFADFSKLRPEEGAQIKVVTNMAKVINPEITTPVTWAAQFALPMQVMEHYTGKLGSLNAVTWRANFYKCGDNTSHPHWISWNPLTETNYHLPECFGTVTLE